MSTIFHWKQSDVDALLATCDADDVTPLIWRYVPPGSLALESGCGAGRYVRYLHDRGWRVVGLEYSAETVSMVHRIWPDLNIIQGDAAHPPFRANQFDAVLSLGVVEHWPDGPAAPLADIYRVLKRGGIAIITVPCLNGIRQLKRSLWLDEIAGAPRATLASLIRRRPLILSRARPSYRYAVFPPYGRFFEYRLTTQEYTGDLQKTGFELINLVPAGMIDSIFHEVNPFWMCVAFYKKFYVTPLGRAVQMALRDHLFLLSHAGSGGTQAVTHVAGVYVSAWCPGTADA